jgi:ATP/ADP translocase
MKERLYRALNIRNSESSQVFDLLTVQFFIGLANALVSIVAFTLFIYNFQIHSLPLVYLSIAGVLMLLNILYEKLEHRFSPLQLLKYVLSFGLVLLVGLWMGLTIGHKDNFIFMLLVSSVLIYMVTGYAYWGLVSLLFNVRESRRIFSIVGAGDIPAKLIGYILAPLLIPLLGINNLLWLAIFSFGLGLVLFTRCIRKKNWEMIKSRSHEHHHHNETPVKKFDFINFFFKNKLIFIISLLSILSYNVFVLIDFTFISQVKIKFHNVTDLAVYIGVFFALGRVIALAFKLIFTSRVIEKLGVIYCLFITPVALFVFCLLFFFYGENSRYNVYIFGLMAMLTEVLRSTMQEPVFFILFQPLKENLRLKGHMISKGYMYPPSLIIVGLSLLFLHNAGMEITIMRAIKIVIVNLAVWAGIIFFMRRIYLHTIHDSIKKGTYNSDDIYIADQQTIDILLQKIKTGKKIEVIYALNLLEKADYPGLGELLDQQLTEGTNTEVKKYVLDRMDVLGKANVAALQNLLNTEADTELQQKVISLLCKHDPAFLKQSSEKIDSYDYSLRKVIIVNLLNQREFNYLFIAGNEINKLLYSTDPVEREVAVEIISELKHVQFSDAVETLINDEEYSVKRVAITAACKLQMHSLLPSIIRLLDVPSDKNIVLKGLQLYGDTLFEDISKIDPDLHNDYLPDLVKIAGKIKGKHSTNFLISKLNDHRTESKDKILHALWIKGYEPTSITEKEVFQNLLGNFLQSGLDKISDYYLIPDFEDKDLIKRSIGNEIKNDLTIALKVSVLLFQQKEINRILELMEIDKNEKLYNAMEMLELVLPKKVSTDVNLLFDFILDTQHQNRQQLRKDINYFYTKAIFNEPLLYNSWTKAVCVYSSWRINESVFLDRLIENNLSNEHFIVTETRDYVMDAIKHKVCL